MGILLHCTTCAAKREERDTTRTGDAKESGMLARVPVRLLPLRVLSLASSDEARGANLADFHPEAPFPDIASFLLCMSA